MARLEYTLTDITAQGHEPATMVSLAGSVDPDTLEIFEEMMDKLTDGGRFRIIFNLEKLKYINSTGMGMSVQFADQLTEENGGLVFMKVPPKVLLVIEMLGLQELFQIVSTEEQAFAALAGSDVGPASIEVKLEEGPSTISPEPVSIEAFEPEEMSLDEQFAGGVAQVISCPVCSAQLSIPGAGVFRCARCRSAIEADNDGNCQGYPEPVSHIAEFAIPADDDYLIGAAWMVNMAGLKAGLSETDSQNASNAAQGCLSTLAREAINGSSERSRLHMFIRSENGRLSVRIYCGGNALSSTEGIDPYRPIVDRLEYMTSAEGNLITIEKSNA
ncbi:MAG: STAS domain-containing protein [Planctomycetes bacterium]|nr:STAS domain-containing protein [Planctomycetota bacterium]